MEEGNTDIIIDIWKANKGLLASMQQKISEPPRLLSRTAGKRSCCIHRVPQSLVDINGKAYQPQIVSIGPYHYGQSHLEMIQEHKWVYLGSLLSRTQTKGLVLEDYLRAVAALESKTRECYSETIQLSSDEFIETLVLDGCFLMELFGEVSKLVPFDLDDPLVNTAWVLAFLSRNFLRLENQIPYFILECLFDLTKMPRDDCSKTLSSLALTFFNKIGLERDDEMIIKYANLTGLHLLDLIRSSFALPEEIREPRQRVQSTPNHIIHCISKLRRAGIELRSMAAESILIIKFSHGVIRMPTITIDDFMNTFLLNCVAFEQCHSHSTKHFTTYATLLDYLINTQRDVEYLTDSGIVENYLGTESDISFFINNMGKDISVDVNLCYLSELFNDVHHYYENSWHVQWASFKYTYFDTPWSFISALAAFVLLVLTVTQTFFAVYAYVFMIRTPVHVFIRNDLICSCTRNISNPIYARSAG